ncbi:putative F-box protein [Trifolium repens]|nr:putative F-box protein [Trifolium repens]
MTDSGDSQGGRSKISSSLLLNGNNCNKNSSEMLKVRNHIPDDLAFFVLSKLPLKSLKRFGCVCKTWSLLFENQHFMSKFRTNFISHCCSDDDYNDTSSILLYESIYQDNTEYCSFYSLSGKSYENRVKLDFPNPFQVENPRFDFFDCDTITGTICLLSEITFVLWKPTTHEFKVIPPSPAESISPCIHTNVFGHGFGYDPVRDDIKLITYTTFIENSREDLKRRSKEELAEYKELVENLKPDLWQIYSLRSNSWKKLDFDMPIRWFHNMPYGRLYTEGVFHWWSDDDLLVSFDLSNEMFFTTAIPIDPNLSTKKLVMLNGSIASIICCITYFHISILGELGVNESWTKLFVVRPLPRINRVVGVGKNGDIFLRTCDGELVLFDLNTGRMEGMGFKGGYVYDTAIFKENHILMEGGME